MFPRTVVIGAPGVGKTTLLERHFNNKFEYKYKSTIAVNMYGDHGIYIWDCSGQPRFESIVTTFMKKAKIAIIVCDDSNYRIKPYLKICSDNDIQQIYVVLNKCDHHPSHTRRKLATIIKKDMPVGALYFETSAYTEKGISRLFYYHNQISNIFYDKEILEKKLLLQKIENAKSRASGRYRFSPLPPDDKALIALDVKEEREETQNDSLFVKVLLNLFF